MSCVLCGEPIDKGDEWTAIPGTKFGYHDNCMVIVRALFKWIKSRVVPTDG